MTKAGSAKPTKGQTETPYRLSNEQLLSIYKSIIQPTYIDGKPASISPRFVVVAAQPGAGKSRLSESLQNAFKRVAEPAVHVDVDALRPYHEKFDEIMRDAPMKMDDHTGYEVWVWKGYLLNDAHSAKNNVVMEVTLRTVDQTRDQINFFKKEGYAVDMHVLAVHESISRLAIFQRFEGMIERGETPRRVDLDFHDQACAALPGNIREIEHQCALDLAAVHNREGRILYARRGQSGDARGEQAILLERERAWSSVESLQHITDWRNVAVKAQKRPAGPLKAAFYMTELQQAIMQGISHPQLQLPIPAIEQDRMPVPVKFDPITLSR